MQYTVSSNQFILKSLLWLGARKLDRKTSVVNSRCSLVRVLSANEATTFIGTTFKLDAPERKCIQPI